MYPERPLNRGREPGYTSGLALRVAQVTGSCPIDRNLSKGSY